MSASQRRPVQGRWGAGGLVLHLTASNQLSSIEQFGLLPQIGPNSVARGWCAPLVHFYEITDGNDGSLRSLLEDLASSRGPSTSAPGRRRAGRAAPAASDSVALLMVDSLGFTLEEGTSSDGVTGPMSRSRIDPGRLEVIGIDVDPNCDLMLLTAESMELRWDAMDRAEESEISWRSRPLLERWARLREAKSIERTFVRLPEHTCRLDVVASGWSPLSPPLPA